MGRGMASLPSEPGSAYTTVLTQSKGPVKPYPLPRLCSYAPPRAVTAGCDPGAHTQIFSQAPRIFCSRDFQSRVDIIVFSWLFHLLRLPETLCKHLPATTLWQSVSQINCRCRRHCHPLLTLHLAAFNQS